MRKVALLIFLISLFAIIYQILLADINEIDFYYLTTITLFSGCSLYPLNFKFENIRDFLIIPILIVLIFTVCNILYLNSYHENLAVLNIVIGVFSFAQFWVSKRLALKKK